MRDSEEKYRTLVNNLSSGMVVHASDSSILFTNQMASTLLGLSNDEMQGKSGYGSGLVLSSGKRHAHASCRISSQYGAVLRRTNG